MENNAGNTTLLENEAESNTTQNKKRNECTVCGKIFEWRSGLSRHSKLFHSDNSSSDTSYECHICGQIFRKQMGLSVHMKYHEKSADIPRSEIEKISKIYANIVNETVYSSDSDCEYEILQTIVKLNPDLNGGNKCVKCSKNFVKAESLQRHLRKHSSDDKDSLKVIDNGGSDTSNVQNVCVPKHTCKKCKKTFTSSCNLANHSKIHLKHSIALKRHQNKPIAVKKTYPCQLCSRVYLKQLHLDNHYLVTHSKDSCPATKTKKLPQHHLCVVCGQGYTSSSNLSVHMRTHENYKPHLCSECGKSFTIKRYLTVHQRIHTKERPFICEYCNKGFIQKGNLTEHLRTHTGIKPHTCATCGKKFAHYSGLTQHLSTHTSDKKYTCSICEKSFRMGSHFREHMRVHSGDRPYACDVCDNRFTNSSTLVVHMRTHSGDRPYRCDVCKKGFIKSYGLKQHKRTHAACNADPPTAAEDVAAIIPSLDVL